MSTKILTQRNSEGLMTCVTTTIRVLRRNIFVGNVAKHFTKFTCTVYMIQAYDKGFSK